VNRTTTADAQVNVLPGVDPPAGQLGDDQPSAADINTALASSGASVCTTCTTPTCSQFAVTGSTASLINNDLQQGIINAFVQANSLTANDVNITSLTTNSLTSG